LRQNPESAERLRSWRPDRGVRPECRRRSARECQTGVPLTASSMTADTIATTLVPVCGTWRLRRQITINLVGVCSYPPLVASGRAVQRGGFQSPKMIGGACRPPARARQSAPAGSAAQRWTHYTTAAGAKEGCFAGRGRADKNTKRLRRGSAVDALGYYMAPVELFSPRVLQQAIVATRASTDPGSALYPSHTVKTVLSDVRFR